MAIYNSQRSIKPRKMNESIDTIGKYGKWNWRDRFLLARPRPLTIAMSLMTTAVVDFSGARAAAAALDSSAGRLHCNSLNWKCSVGKMVKATRILLTESCTLPEAKRWPRASLKTHFRVDHAAIIVHHMPSSQLSCNCVDEANRWPSKSGTSASSSV